MFLIHDYVSDCDKNLTDMVKILQLPGLILMESLKRNTIR